MSTSSKRTGAPMSCQQKANLKYKYGITYEQYNELFNCQEGKCAICETHQSELSKRLAVDHNHKTGEIRSLLCQACNVALGLVAEDKIILEKMIQYIK